MVPVPSSARSPGNEMSGAMSPTVAALIGLSRLRLKKAKQYKKKIQRFLTITALRVLNEVPLH
jgi:hypothetical protein